MADGSSDHDSPIFALTGTGWNAIPASYPVLQPDVAGIVASYDLRESRPALNAPRVIKSSEPISLGQNSTSYASAPEKSPNAKYSCQIRKVSKADRKPTKSPQTRPIETVQAISPYRFTFIHVAQPFELKPQARDLRFRTKNKDASITSDGNNGGPNMTNAPSGVPTS